MATPVGRYFAARLFNLEAWLVGFRFAWFFFEIGVSLLFGLGRFHKSFSMTL